MCVVVVRTMQVIDEMAREVLDPRISAHWSNVSSATESIVKVTISFYRYETCKYVMSIMVYVRDLLYYSSVFCDV